MSFTSFSIAAHTKVNLALKILGRRNDGYHELDTIFQELEWGDHLHFEPAEEFGFRTTGLEFDHGDENICLSAYRLYSKAIGKQLAVEITLEKHVPPGTGLGGGSADAAAVLKGLNRIAPIPLADLALHELATRLGADVPFFLRGGLQRGRGIGEELEPLEEHLGGVYLLVLPPLHVATKQAFSALKYRLTAPGSPITFRRPLQWADMVRFFENDFESVVFHMHPEIGSIKEVLLEEGAHFASLSGSGSTVYGIFETREAAQAAQTVFLNRYHTQITTPLS
jgi:4-diphosphocytidyl-2-C-methyl-D-erythritol kinase